MKLLGVAFFVFMSISNIAFASCDVPSDSASDGSRCGGRAASEKPGGK